MKPTLKNERFTKKDTHKKNEANIKNEHINKKTKNETCCVYKIKQNIYFLFFLLYYAIALKIGLIGNSTHRERLVSALTKLFCELNEPDQTELTDGLTQTHKYPKNSWQ